MSLGSIGPNVARSSYLAHTPSHQREGHVVQLYTDDGFLCDVLSRFVGGALASGDGVLVLVTAAHRAEMERQLSAHGLDTDKAAMQGRYIVLDAPETLAKFMVAGTVDETRFKEIIGGALNQARLSLGKGRPLAVFGELVALLWAQGKANQAIRVEELWNELAQAHSFSLLCAYPMAGFEGGAHIEPFLKMCGQHSSVIPNESYLTLGSEEERLRSVAHLQQKTQALERELASRDSEARFRLLVEAVKDYAIFMLDPAGVISSWNVGAQRLKGYNAGEIIGKHFSCFYPEEDVRSGKPQWELVVAAEEGRFEDEGWRIRKDGSRFWANVVITAVRDATGKLIGYAKVTRDFTDRLEIQNALQKEVAERRDAQQRLHKSEKALRELSLHLIRTQDEERRRIGRDLHDSLGQYLAALKMNLDSMASARGQQDNDFAQAVKHCIQLTEDSIKEVRTVSYLLYPPLLEEMGLKSAIPWYLDGFSARSGIRTSFQLQPGIGRFPRDSELALFRVLQEGLANVHRHSQSETADVRLLVRDGMAVLEIEDHGNGISPELIEQFDQDWMGAPGVGVRGMNERMRQLNGRLELASSETGTVVRAIIPAEESPTPPGED